MKTQIVLLKYNIIHRRVARVGRVKLNAKSKHECNS